MGPAERQTIDFDNLTSAALAVCRDQNGMSEVSCYSMGLSLNSVLVAEFEAQF